MKSCLQETQGGPEQRSREKQVHIVSAKISRQAFLISLKTYCTQVEIMHQQAGKLLTRT